MGLALSLTAIDKGRLACVQGAGRPERVDCQGLLPACLIQTFRGSRAGSGPGRPHPLLFTVVPSVQGFQILVMVTEYMSQAEPVGLPCIKSYESALFISEKHLNMDNFIWFKRMHFYSVFIAASRRRSDYFCFTVGETEVPRMSVVWDANLGMSANLLAVTPGSCSLSTTFPSCPCHTTARFECIYQDPRLLGWAFHNHQLLNIRAGRGCSWCGPSSQESLRCFGSRRT